MSIIDNHLGSVSEPTLKPVKSNSLRQQVQEAIRLAIFSGKLKPGMSLRELQLARELRVSQSTVREALLQLEHTGLVVREENKQTRVTSLSREELSERLALRVELEGMAGVAAAPRMLDSHFQELSARSSAIALEIDQERYFEASQVDLEFHRMVWDLSGNRTLYQMLDHLTAPLFAFVSILRAAGLAGFEQPGTTHDPIVAALRSGVEAEIRRAFENHMASVYNEFIKSGMQDFSTLAEGRARRHASEGV